MESIPTKTNLLPPLIRFAKVLLITIVMLGMLEVIARVITWQPLKTIEQTQSDLGTVRHGYYANGSGDLKPLQNGIWTIWNRRPYNVQTNSMGLRNEEEINDDGNTFLILTIGDSFTFGPYVPNQDTWPAQLERNLNNHFREVLNVQVLNAGIAGYTMSDELSYLRDKGLDLMPDLVILGFFTNDISDYRAAKRAEFARPDATTFNHSDPVADDLIQFINHSGMVELARSLARRNSPIENLTGEIQNDQLQSQITHQDILFFAPESEEAISYWQQYEIDLRNTIQLLKDNSIPFIIVVFPEWKQILPDGYPDTPQQFINDIATQVDTPVVDLLPIFRQSGDVESLYLKDYDMSIPLDSSDPFLPEHPRYTGNGHLSRFGYLVAARSIGDYIINSFPIMQ